MIEDLMDPNVQHGELGLMFTTLKVGLPSAAQTGRLSSPAVAMMEILGVGNKAQLTRTFVNKGESLSWSWFH